MRTVASTPEADEQLDASIQAHGVLLPILVVLRDGALIVVAGMRRRAAALRTGQARVPIRIMELSDRDAERVAADENDARLQRCAWDKARGVRRYLKGDPDATIATIRAEIGGSVGYVSKYRQIATALTPAVLEAAGVSEVDLCSLQVQDLDAAAHQPDTAARARVLAYLVASRAAEAAPDGKPSTEQTQTQAQTRNDRARDASDASEGGTLQRPWTLRSQRDGTRHVLRVSPSMLGAEHSTELLHDLARFVEFWGPQFSDLAPLIRTWAMERGWGEPTE